MKGVPGKDWLHKQGNGYLLSIKQAGVSMSASNKILHEEGDFRLITLEEVVGQGQTSSLKKAGWQSWIWHRCPKRDNTWIACSCVWTGECFPCSEPIPEEIYGLWKLHNFDMIQKRVV